MKTLIFWRRIFWFRLEWLGMDWNQCFGLRSIQELERGFLGLQNIFFYGFVHKGQTCTHENMSFTACGPGLSSLTCLARYTDNPHFKRCPSASVQQQTAMHICKPLTNFLNDPYILASYVQQTTELSSQTALHVLVLLSACFGCIPSELRKQLLIPLLPSNVYIFFQVYTTFNPFLTKICFIFIPALIRRIQEFVQLFQTGYSHRLHKMEFLIWR